MGNNPSHSIAAAGATATLSNKMNDINKQLGIGDDGKATEINVPKVIGCSNRKEQKQRHTDRQKEYEMKQKDRTDRLKDIENKRGKAIQGEEPSDIEMSHAKDQEIKAKIAELKKQSLLRAKLDKPKKKGFFGGSSSKK